MTRNPITFNYSSYEVWKVMEQIYNITKFGRMGGELRLTSNPGLLLFSFSKKRDLLYLMLASKSPLT